VGNRVEEWGKEMGRENRKNGKGREGRQGRVVGKCKNRETHTTLQTLRRP